MVGHVQATAPGHLPQVAVVGNDCGHGVQQLENAAIIGEGISRYHWGEEPLVDPEAAEGSLDLHPSRRVRDFGLAGADDGDSRDQHPDDGGRVVGSWRTLSTSSSVTRATRLSSAGSTPLSCRQVALVPQLRIAVLGAGFDGEDRGVVVAVYGVFEDHAFAGEHVDGLAVEMEAHLVDSGELGEGVHHLCQAAEDVGSSAACLELARHVERRQTIGDVQAEEERVGGDRARQAGGRFGGVGPRSGLGSHCRQLRVGRRRVSRVWQ